MNKQLLTLTLLFFVTLLQAQSSNAVLDWALSIGSSGADKSTSFTTDGVGNLYITGFFGGTVDFDPDTSVSNLTSAGAEDIFICKFDTSGNFVWAKSMGGVGADKSTKIFLDASNNIYIAGSFSISADMDPGIGTNTLTSAGGIDAFFSKLDASGNFVWAKGFGDLGADIVAGILVANNGDIYLTGTFQSTVDFDPGADSTKLSAANVDVFVSKFNTSGNFIWAKKVGGSSIDLSHSIALSNAGKIHIVGGFIGTVDFDPGAGSDALISNGANDAFILQLDTAGNYVFAKQIGGATGNDFALDVAIDASNNIFAVGTILGSVDLDPGNGTEIVAAVNGGSFILKLNANGAFVWAESFSSTSGPVQVAEIELDNAGNIFTTGAFIGSVDFDPGINQQNVISSGNYDVYVSKLDASAQYVWAVNMGGSFQDIGISIQTDNTGNVYVTGNFKSSPADFDTGLGTFDLSTAGNEDVFVLNLNSSSPNSIPNTFGNDLKVYPNPTANNRVRIDLGETYESVNVKLYNLLGQLVSKKQFANVHTFNYPVNGVDGIYILYIQSENGKSATVKILKN